MKTGFKDIDDLLGGGLKGGILYILASRPGIDRGTLAMNMMLKMMDEGKKIAYFSFESTMEQVMTTLLLMKAKVDTKAVIDPTEEDLAAIESAANEIAGADLIVIDEARLDIDELIENILPIPEYQERDVIIIDDIQFFTAVIPDTNYVLTSRDEISGYICRNLKSIAKWRNIPIIVLSQVDREVDQRDDKRPALTDLKPASDLEYYADVVMFLYRDDHYNKDTELRGIAEVIVAKNLWGRTGKCNLVHIPDYMAFVTILRS
ncbi:MAG: hypothetical protein K6G27_09875 [Lachnospiraceae bacterium]|nr:hypothetical protein [Lachnospiraceae bacterium]